MSVLAGSALLSFQSASQVHSKTSLFKFIVKPLFEFFSDYKKYLGSENQENNSAGFVCVTGDR